VLNDRDSGWEDTSEDTSEGEEGEGEGMDWMDEDNREVQGNDEDNNEDEYLPDTDDSSENEEEEWLPCFVKSVQKPHSLPPKALLQLQADTV
jgi:hypothetical protein